VPPAAQRRLVRRTRDGSRRPVLKLSTKQVTFLTAEPQRSYVTVLGYFFTPSAKEPYERRYLGVVMRYVTSVQSFGDY